MSRGSLRTVTKRYGRRQALTGVTLQVDAGEILGLIGPNGAGKTTLLRVMAGLLRPSSGAVETSAAVRYFGGEHTLPPSVSARAWLRLWSIGARGLSRASAGDPQKAATQSLGALSRGSRQRVGLEAALAERQVELLLLDEPWEGLDPDASRWLSDQLRQRRDAGAGVIVSSHRIHDLADVCDRAIFLVGGRLQSDSVTAGDLSSAADRSAVLFAAFDRLKQR